MLREDKFNERPGELYENVKAVRWGLEVASLW